MNALNNRMDSSTHGAFNNPLLHCDPSVQRVTAGMKIKTRLIIEEGKGVKVRGIDRLTKAYKLYVKVTQDGKVEGESPLCIGSKSPQVRYSVDFDIKPKCVITISVWNKSDFLFADEFIGAITMDSWRLRKITESRPFDMLGMNDDNESSYSVGEAISTRSSAEGSLDGDDHYWHELYRKKPKNKEPKLKGYIFVRAEELWPEMPKKPVQPVPVEEAYLSDDEGDDDDTDLLANPDNNNSPNLLGLQDRYSNEKRRSIFSRDRALLKSLRGDIQVLQKQAQEVAEQLEWERKVKEEAEALAQAEKERLEMEEAKLFLERKGRAALKLQSKVRMNIAKAASSVDGQKIERPFLIVIDKATSLKGGKSRNATTAAQKAQQASRVEKELVYPFIYVSVHGRDRKNTMFYKTNTRRNTVEEKVPYVDPNGQAIRRSVTKWEESVLLPRCKGFMVIVFTVIGKVFYHHIANGVGGESDCGRVRPRRGESAIMHSHKHSPPSKYQSHSPPSFLL
jgi:hypothetical protein